jgi:transcriptional regulator with XRE-family HTH domain
MAGGLMHSCTWKESISTQENPYHFTDSGLRNVYLIGVRRVECDCGEKYVEIPAIKQLLSLMARDVVMKREALIGDEIRFLRKHLGQKAADFSLKVGLKPETLSRVENGKQQIGKRADNYIRIYYALASKDEILLDAIKEALDTVLTEQRKKPLRKPPKTVARIEHDEWTLDAA